MKDEEHRLQCACVRWFRYAYPHHLLYAVPNGGQRSVATAARLKAEGVLAGVPDLFLSAARGGFHGLYIEMKDGRKGRVSESQRGVMERLTAEGYLCAVCRSFDEFRSTVEEYLRGAEIG